MEQLYSAYQHQSPSFNSGNLADCSLTLCITTHMVSYSISSPARKVMAVKEYRSKSPLAIQDMLDAALEQDSFLREPFFHVKVLMGLNEFALVPREHFDGGKLRQYVTALIKQNPDADEVRSAELSTSGTQLIFTYPLILSQKLKVHFPSAAIVPLAQSIMGVAALLSQPRRDTLLLHVLDHEAIVVGLKAGQLALCNTYPWHTPTDLLYFTQLAYDLLQTGPDLCDTHLTGAFETGSDLDRTVRQHLPSINIPTEPLRSLFEVQGEKLPLWKYAYLSL